MPHFRFAIACAALSSAVSAFAVPLTGPFHTALPGTTAAARPELAGTVLVDRITPFSYTRPLIGGTISGTIQESVLRSSLDGTLDFYWRITSDATSAARIGELDLYGFNTTRYDADWRIDGLGTQPATDAGHTGGDVRVRFYTIWDIVPVGGIAPDSSSKFVFLDTDATNYAETAMMRLSDINCLGCFSGSSPLMSTFAPAPVPEPQALGMVLAGLSVVGLWARRRGRIEAAGSTSSLKRD